MSKPAICLEGVSFSYSHSEGDTLFENIDLDVFPGELVCLVGPNGGGKSTLLKLILGELRPLRGRVLICGEDRAKSRVRIGYLPQSIHWDAEFPITVGDVVLTSRCHFGPVRSEDRATVADSLETVGLSEHRETPFADLSGGMRQRVLLARALAGEPDILLMDEPTANVDPGNAKKINDVLGKIEGKLACVLVSHDMEFVTSLVRQVVCVHRHLEIHPTEAFYDQHAEALFGTPLRRVVHGQKLPLTEHRHD